MGRTMRAWPAVALLLAACGGAGPVATEQAPAEPGCDGELAGYRVKGKALKGDVDGDGRADRVTLRVDRRRPRACRRVVVVETASKTIAAPVRPLPWPGTAPRLLLLAEIDGRAGVEPVVTLSPANVYRPGAVFAARDGGLVRLRLAAGAPRTSSRSTTSSRRASTARASRGGSRSSPARSRRTTRSGT